MSKSDDDFICPDCVGDGEVQCVNLGPTYRSDTLPCPTCIAHEIEQERASKADEITRLTARVKELEGALERIDRIEVYDEDARETLRSKLGVMRDIARAALEEK